MTDQTSGGAEPLKIQVGVENGKVICLFSQQLATFSLPPAEAEKMGRAMIHHAEEARKLGAS